jgi:hypothetical protein
MSNDTIERIARALCDAAPVPASAARNSNGWREYVFAARAAVKAMWEPSEEMVAIAVALMAETDVTLAAAGKRGTLGKFVSDEGELGVVFRNGWRGAIDTALR